MLAFLIASAVCASNAERVFWGIKAAISWSECRDGEIAVCSEIIEGKFSNTVKGLALNERGVNYMREKDYTRALRDFTQSMELNPHLASSFFNRGLLLYELNDFRSAIDDFNRAIKLDPKFGRAFYNKAIAEEAIGQLLRSRRDFAKAAALGYASSGQIAVER